MRGIRPGDEWRFYAFGVRVPYWLWRLLYGPFVPIGLATKAPDIATREIEMVDALRRIDLVLTTVEGDDIPRAALTARTIARDALDRTGFARLDTVSVERASEGSSF